MPLDYKLFESRDLASCFLLLETQISIMPFAGIWGSVVNNGEHHDGLEHHAVDKEAALVP